VTLAASILIGFPLGFWLSFRRRAQVTFGVVWVIVLVVQTLDLTFDTSAPNYGVTHKWYYWVAQPAIFALGIALLWLGARVRARRLPATR
jgi:putative effector of murein hydrolase